MNIETLKKQLEHKTSVDLDSLYLTFQSKSEMQDVDSFLGYLHENKWIDTATFCDFYANERIEITNLGGSILSQTGVLNKDDDGLQINSTHPPPKFNLLGMVGEGAMGQVFLAKDVDLLRKVAYKKLNLSDKVVNQEVIEQFLNEVQITAQLGHPNVIPIYNLEVTQEGLLAYSMKLVQGKTLKELIQEARVLYQNHSPIDQEHSLETFLDHFLKVCDAMDFAHSKGVIHRDLKPANIMVGQYNEVAVMDWGIARLMGGKKETGKIIGTPRYMSPEQAGAMNDRLDGRSDQFALGLILYELITLNRVFQGASLDQIVLKIIRNQREPLKAFSPQLSLPPELIAIHEKAASRKRKDRYQTVGDFADDIRRYLRGEAVLAKPDNTLQSSLRWIRQHSKLTLIGVMGIFLLSTSATAMSMYSKQKAAVTAQIREKNLNAFLLQVTNQRIAIESRFIEFEGYVEGLSTAVKHLYFGAPLKQEKFYTDLDNLNQNTQAPDFKYSPFYKQKVSVNWNIFKLSPGNKYQDLLPDMYRYAPLRHYYKELALKSFGEESLTYSPEKASQLIFEGKAPLIWAYVGFETGLISSYPGKTNYKPEYDPRQRPWYTSTVGTHGVHWKEPYIDQSGMGLSLPCTSAIYNEQNQLIGVAAADMTFDYIIQNLLQIRSQSAIKDVYLLSKDGKIIVKSSRKRQAYAQGTLINTMDELPVYPNMQVVNQIKNQQSGFVEEINSGQRTLIAFYKLNRIGWYYVVEADSQRLFKSGQN